MLSCRPEKAEQARGDHLLRHRVSIPHCERPLQRYVSAQLEQTLCVQRKYSHLPSPQLNQPGTWMAQAGRPKYRVGASIWSWWTIPRALKWPPWGRKLARSSWKMVPCTSCGSAVPATITHSSHSVREKRVQTSARGELFLFFFKCLSAQITFEANPAEEEEVTSST